MYKEKSSAEVSFKPGPWEGSLLEGLKAGRFSLPSSAFISAGIETARRLSAKSSPYTKHEVSPAWDALINYLSRKGLIEKQTSYERWFSDGPKLYSASFVANTRSLNTRGHSWVRSFSRGTSHIFEEALSKGIGEFLERYALMEYQDDMLLRASSKTLENTKRKFLPLDSIGGFTEEQKKHFPEFQISEDAPVVWVEGKELTSNTSALIPAQLVFWNYCRHRYGFEPVLRHSNTNGAAGGFTREMAAVSGLRELLQRDAFLMHWLTKSVPQRIVPDTVTNSAFAKLLEEVRSLNIDVHFLKVTVDHETPTCTCVLVSNESTGKRPKVSLGGGCSSTYEDAMWDALREAVATHRWLRDKAENSEQLLFDAEAYQPFIDSSIDQAKRLRVWAMPQMFPHFNWILTGEGKNLSHLRREDMQRVDDTRELQRLVEFFKRKGSGYEIYMYDATTPVLESVGFASVKMIVPQLINLYLDEIYAPLAAERLTLLKPGLAPGANRVFSDFYTFPHPFP